MIPARRRGFTLLEVVIALAMISVVLTLAYASFATSIRIVEQRETRTRSLHRADFMLRHLADQLQSIYLDQAAFYRLDDPLALFDGSGDRLVFWTQAPAQTRRVSHRGGVQRLAYGVAPAVVDPGTRAEDDPGLELRFAAFAELADDPDEPIATWALPVESVEFEYHDGAGWSGSWDIADAARLPRGIRVTIEMPDGRGDTLEVRTVIPLAVTAETVFETEDQRAGGGRRGAGDEVETAAGDDGSAAGRETGGNTGSFNPFGSSGGGNRRRDPIKESQRDS